MSDKIRPKDEEVTPEETPEQEEKEAEVIEPGGSQADSLRQQARQILEGDEAQEVILAEEDDQGRVINNGPFGALMPKVDIFPDQLGIIAVQHRPLFPHMVIPLVVEGDMYLRTLDLALKSEPGYIGIVLGTNRFDPENPKLEHLHKVGVVARIAKVFSKESSSSQVLLDVIERIRLKEEVSMGPHMVAKVEYIKTGKVKINDEIRAYSREILANMKELIRLNPLIKEELNQFINQISVDDPSRLADFAATLTSADKEELQGIVGTIPIVPRLGKTLLLIKKELELSRLQAEISQKIEERISEHQREFFLREQLKEIQKELGISKDEKTQEIEKLLKKAKKLKFSEEAQKRFDEELEKMALLDIQSPEFNVSRNYLDWITSLPWGIFSKDNLDLKKAEKILNQDHYGLEEVKEAILEFIATLKQRQSPTGTILCFVGPPGVGKTSIGKSIARALGKKFYRFSVGGMRDEAEIKGHRRTYIGAMPGKFLQALKITGAMNSVIMLDEIDKIGSSYQGDPASALLEVLDPEQNNSFLDHYLDVPFDLSKLMFITTANQLDTIPPALLDRMEVLRLSGYITQEKLHIAKKYLIPKQRKEHGLSSGHLSISEPALKNIIDGYAREAGVRNLENQIKKICRKVTKELALGSQQTKFSIGTKEVEKYLKSPVFEEEEVIGEGRIGVVTGLAWTSMGGAILSIEAARLPAKQKGFKQTGQLGDVMIESSEIAFSYACAQAKRFGGEQDWFDSSMIHLHVPAGATPKDGPSAGITMTTALLSLLLDQPVVPKLGMTGELSLTGEVLPIGGLKEKIIAARRAGLRKIIIPKGNKKDYDELPDHLKENLSIHLAGVYDDVFEVAFDKKLKRSRGKKK